MGATSFTYADLFHRPHFHQNRPFQVDEELARYLQGMTLRQRFPVFLAAAQMTTGGVTPGHAAGEQTDIGHGASFSDPGLAFTKSVAEACERTFSRIHDLADLPLGTYDKLSSRAVSPEKFSLLSQWERQQQPLPYVPYSPRLRLHWAECYRVQPGSLTPVLIPARLIYAGYGERHPEEHFVPNVSVGLACHDTYTGSFLNGLLEWIERDAFMLCWLHKRSPPLIEVEVDVVQHTFPAIEWMRQRGFVFHFADLTTDLRVPVVLSVVENPKLPWEGKLVFGLGCHPDPRKALAKALLEALTVLSNDVRLDPVAGRIAVHPDATRPRFETTVRDYHAFARFLIEGGERVEPAAMVTCDHGDPKANLDALLARLADSGRETFFNDLTPERWQGRSRWCVTRALVTGLQPMLLETDCLRLNPTRLFPDLGDTEGHVVEQRFEKLNLTPHPFQ